MDALEQKFALEMLGVVEKYLSLGVEAGGLGHLTMSIGANVLKERVSDNAIMKSVRVIVADVGERAGVPLPLNRLTHKTGLLQH